MAIKIHIDDAEIDLFAEEKFALTKQVADLASLSDIKGDFSLSFSVPYTDRNRRVFEHNDKPTTRSSMPYIKLPARVYSDNIEIVSDGVCYIEGDEDKGYRATIYSGNVSWSNLLDSKTIRDIDFSDVAHVWNKTNQIDSHQNVRPYVYPFVDYGVEDVDGKATPTFAVPEFLRPWVYFKEIINRIFSAIGYTVEGDLLDIPKYDGALLECNRIEYPSELIGVHAVVDNTSGPVVVTAIPKIPITTLVDDVSYLGFPVEIKDTFEELGVGNLHEFITTTVTVPGWGSAAINGSKIYPPKNGTYFFEMLLDLSLIQMPIGTVPPNQITLDIYYKTSAGIGYLFTWSAATNGSVKQFSIPISDYTTQTEITFFTRPQDYILHINPGSYMKVTGFTVANSDDTIQIGDPVVLNTMLPEIGQIDFVRAVAIMFGQSIIPDEQIKKITFRSWDRLADGKATAPEWDSYIDDSARPTTKYHLEGWAQRNHFKYEPDEGVLAGFGDGVLLMADQWAEGDRDVVVLPFVACQYGPTGAPYILRLEETTPASPYPNHKWVGDSGPRVLTSERLAGLAGEIGGTAFTGVVLSWFTKSTEIQTILDAEGVSRPDGMAFNDSLLPDHYGFTTLLLDRPRVIEVPARLLPPVIQAFEPFQPVYVSKYGHHFFVNKIQNWQTNGRCKLVLVKI